MRRAPADLGTVLHAVLERAADLCGAERASIHLLEGDVYRTAAFWGPSDPEYERVAYHTTRTPGRETLIGRTALTRTVVHIPDVLADPEYTAKDLQRLGGYRTMLGVPLMRGEAVVGVFSLTRNEVRPFTDREIALVRAFADQAVVAVENARLLKSTTEALERQTAIAEVLKEMSRSVFDLDRVLESVALNAVRLCGADTGSIARVKGDAWELATTVGDAAYSEAIERNWTTRKIEPDRRSLTGRVLIERGTVTIADALADPEYDRGSGLLKLRSLIGVPLKRGDEIVGVLILRRAEPEPFTPEQVHLVETFADQAAIAIENVRLFNETKESLERQTALAEILAIISSSRSDLKPVLEAVARNAVRYCAAEDATVMVVHGDRMLMTAHEGSIPWIAETEWRLDPNRLTGRAVLERRTIHAPDIASEQGDEYPTSKARAALVGARSIVVTPLMRRNDALGAIMLRRTEKRAFTDRQIELLQAFARQAAIAIENVRLFTETEEALARQIAIGEVLRTIGSSAFQLTPVLEAVTDHALRLCHAQSAVIWRTVGNTHRLATRMTSNVDDPGRDQFLEIATRGDMPIGRDSITGRAHLERRPIQVEDMIEYYAGATGPAADIARLAVMRTLLAVPLIRGDRVLGVIALTRREKRLFSESEVELVQTFADQAAIAIANVELFETVERQRQELSRFLSPQVAQLVTSEDGAKLLEGHRRPITVVFCDLRNFTGFAETAEPEEVLGVLREYHGAMGELIVEYRGTLEHFAGDGMMVFFNDPLPVERHELQAVRMACAMRDRFAEMARGWERRGYELGFGVGIATGYATLGRIGFEGRYDYGAVGNVVIMAQRLSAEAKPGQILISQRVRAAVDAEMRTSAIGDLALKGFTRPVPAYAAEPLTKAAATQ